jgi:ribosomal-protein-serine acetyltransferase
MDRSCDGPCAGRLLLSGESESESAGLTVSVGWLAHSAFLPCKFDLTEDTHLRLLVDADTDELHALIASNRAYLSRWMPWASSQTREQTKDFIALSRNKVLDNNGFQAAIVRDEQIVGVVGYDMVRWADRATSIGYWLAEPEQGRGTMTRAVRALVDHALNGWRLNRVEILVAENNARSRAIPERLDFAEEGTLRQARQVGERYLDLVVYSMLADDWS